MTKRQANLIITLLFALIGVQLLFGAILLRGQERTRREAEAAQASAMDTLEMQKKATIGPSITANSITIQPPPAPEPENEPDVQVFGPVKIITR